MLPLVEIMFKSKPVDVEHVALVDTVFFEKAFLVFMLIGETSQFILLTFTLLVCVLRIESFGIV